MSLPGSLKISVVVFFFNKTNTVAVAHQLVQFLLTPISHIQHQGWTQILCPPVRLEPFVRQWILPSGLKE